MSINDAKSSVAAQEWADYFKKEVLLPAVNSYTTRQVLQDMIKTGISKELSNQIRLKLYSLIETSKPNIYKEGASAARHCLDKSKSAYFMNLQFIISSNAAWWIVQPWSVQLYSGPTVRSVLAQPWVFNSLHKIAAESLYPSQVPVVTESFLWYALIAIRASDTKSDVRGTLIASLNASNKKHVKQQLKAMSTIG